MQEVTDRAACETGLSLMDNVTYYSTVTIVNGANLTATHSSDGGKHYKPALLVHVILQFYTS